ncbi:MAG: hypothetical protein R2849_01985 [Thermomicrobiales bacterium]
MLNTYDGTLLFVSHDRFFIDSIANRVWAVEDGKLVQYLGNYTDMLRARERRTSDAEPVEEPREDRSEQPVVRDPSSRHSPRRQLDKELRSARKRLESAERAVSKLEAMLNDINDAIGIATADQDVDRLATLGTQYEQAQTKLEDVYDEWSQAGAQVDRLNREAESLEQEQRA